VSRFERAVDLTLDQLKHPDGETAAY
jgi:hypothetical protein